MEKYFAPAFPPNISFHIDSSKCFFFFWTHLCMSYFGKGVNAVFHLFFPQQKEITLYWHFYCIISSAISFLF